MRQFFHGWRRKAGCVTLMIAATVMCGHLRSHYYRDWIQLHFPRGNGLEIHSRPNTVRFVYNCTTETKGIPPKTSAINWFESKFDKVHFGWEWERPHWGKFEWKSGGNAGGQEHEVSGWGKDITLPYTGLTLPLTLLSAYLILRKPRKRASDD